jgi:hypothetical protein
MYDMILLRECSLSLSRFSFFFLPFCLFLLSVVEPLFKVCATSARTSGNKRGQNGTIKPKNGARFRVWKCGLEMDRFPALFSTHFPVLFMRY